jgi:hypothetical protein
MATDESAALLLSLVPAEAALSSVQEGANWFRNCNMQGPSLLRYDLPATLSKSCRTLQRQRELFVEARSHARADEAPPTEPRQVAPVPGLN